MEAMVLGWRAASGVSAEPSVPCGDEAARAAGLPETFASVLLSLLCWVAMDGNKCGAQVKVNHLDLACQTY